MFSNASACWCCCSLLTVSCAGLRAAADHGRSFSSSSSSSTVAGAVSTSPSSPSSSDWTVLYASSILRVVESRSSWSTSTTSSFACEISNFSRFSFDHENTSSSSAFALRTRSRASSHCAARVLHSSSPARTAPRCRRRAVVPREIAPIRTAAARSLLLRLRSRNPLEAAHASVDASSDRRASLRARKPRAKALIRVAASDRERSSLLSADVLLPAIPR
mmetsp:Transcript_13805/g.40358  ORF Transcript_13805/g.40358 Transcript_13805/m.40358 type:complete len:219 (+) Transcript_13805:1219-1875(+)